MQSIYANFFFIEGINHQAGVKSKQGTTVVNNIDQYNMQQIVISDKTTFPTSTSLLQIKNGDKQTQSAAVWPRCICQLLRDPTVYIHILFLIGRQSMLHVFYL